MKEVRLMAFSGLKKLFGKKEQDSKYSLEDGLFVILYIKARLQPVHRGEMFEDPLDKILREHLNGEVTGGGSYFKENGEVEACDIEIYLKRESLNSFIEFIKRIDFPHGSHLQIDNEIIPIGSLDGMAIYLNGTDLPNEVYKQNDINDVYNELEKLLEGCGEIYSYREAEETALYIYGKDFEEMLDRIKGFLRTSPLCEKCRVVKIAGVKKES